MLTRPPLPLPLTDRSTDGEYAAGHAPGATLAAVWVAGPAGMAPNPTFVATVQAQYPAKDTPLMVVRACARTCAAWHHPPAPHGRAITCHMGHPRCAPLLRGVWVCQCGAFKALGPPDGLTD